MVVVVGGGGAIDLIVVLLVLRLFLVVVAVVTVVVSVVESAHSIINASICFHFSLIWLFLFVAALSVVSRFFITTSIAKSVQEKMINFQYYKKTCYITCMLVKSTEN